MPVVLQLSLSVMEAEAHFGYFYVEASQSSSIDDSDSFTTCVVFTCPNCGLVVDIRRRICHSCHQVLPFCEAGVACEQELGFPRGSSDGTLMDSSQSGSSQLTLNADNGVEADCSAETSGN